MNDHAIYQIALASGFKLKEQPDRTMDLNPYVYRFGHILLEEAAKAQLERLEELEEAYKLVWPLARRCLHLAHVWNDHNFPAAHVMAYDEACKVGVGTLKQANEFIAQLPVPRS